MSDKPEKDGNKSMGLASLRREIMKDITGAESTDLTEALGCFGYLSPNGRLAAIERLQIASDGSLRAVYSKLNFSSFGPVIEQLTRSSLYLEFKRSQPQRSTILMAVGAGDSRRLSPAMGGKDEIVSRALDDHKFPVLVHGEVEKAVARAGSDDKVRIPIRAVRLREHQPAELGNSVRAVAFALLKQPAERLEAVRASLRTMRHALRSEVLESLLSKCIWLNRETGLLGSLTDQGDSVEFVPLDVDDPEISNFQCALQKDFHGDFLLDFREFAHVLPVPKSTTPWLGPTVRIYGEGFRGEYGLDEFYSLHGGFRKLCAIGAPVLLYSGQNPIKEPTEIRFLKITDRSLNVLQGRIDRGQIEQDVRDFATESLVWR
ncbi:MAG: hypothetical protein AAF493_09500 [Pseudomonadota bacterium]